MSFVSSLVRLVSSLFGQAEGSTERATDKLLTSSPEAIRNQFRKTREDWTKDYNEMKAAIAQLVQIRDNKIDEVQKLNTLVEELEVKMSGAINLYKQTQDETLREEYSKLAYTKEEAGSKIATLEKEIQEQNIIIENYKTRLNGLKQDIDNLKKEEAETIADIVSSKKINELNDKLQGLSQNHQAKNLEVIRDARKQVKSEAKLGAEISGLEKTSLDQKLMASGKVSKYLDVFDESVKLDKIFIAEKEIPKQIPAKKVVKEKPVEIEEIKATPTKSSLDNLFS
jgi:chromosome segregation ATPase